MASRITTHVLKSSTKITSPLTLAYVPDIHNGEFESALPELSQVDAILIGGDLVDRYHDGYDQALRFLTEACKLAPTFYASGNHERKMASREAYFAQVAQTGVVLLDGQWQPFRGILLGGMASALRENRSSQWCWTWKSTRLQTPAVPSS